jgi:hypothetical protein
MHETYLGNYTCILREGGGHHQPGGGLRRDAKQLVVSLLPPPPEWKRRLPTEPSPTATTTSQVLEWRGVSKLPIINYQLEVRLRPEEGPGEDWLSIVVPYQVPNTE